MTVTHSARPDRREWKVDIPEGISGDVEIRRFTVGSVDTDLRNLREAMSARSTPSGIYTGLYRGGHLWMSDTAAERRDHADACGRTGRILILGLGLGCITDYLLQDPRVTHVDVVEIDTDVLTLVGPHLAGKYPGRVTVHEGDAFTYVPDGAYDYVWSDIWQHLCTDNLDEMAKLRRRYSRLGVAPADRHGCWGRELLIRQRDLDRRQGWAW